jgi:outer membrane protein with beta-barrel domain
MEGLMRRLFQHCAVIVWLVLIPTVAFAQRRVPATDSGAVGGDVGLFVPRSDVLDAGPALEGFYEYYFTPRGSLRLGLGWANPSFDGRQDDSLRTLRVAVDGVYNWERGAVHPFVGAGLGIYFLQPKNNGNNVGDSETKTGATLFGGAEFFTSRTVSFKAEGRYHLVSDAFGINPGGLALTIGVKKYF